MVALNKETVYLLDDDSSILKSTGRLLDSAGWNNVETFTDPIAFLEQAAKHCPDVAVIDDERTRCSNAAAKRIALDPSHCADCQR